MSGVLRKTTTFPSSLNMERFKSLIDSGRANKTPIQNRMNKLRASLKAERDAEKLKKLEKKAKSHSKSDKLKDKNASAPSTGDTNEKAKILPQNRLSDKTKPEENVKKSLTKCVEKQSSHANDQANKMSRESVPKRRSSRQSSSNSEAPSPKASTSCANKRKRDDQRSEKITRITSPSLISKHVSPKKSKRPIEERFKKLNASIKSGNAKTNAKQKKVSTATNTISNSDDDIGKSPRQTANSTLGSAKVLKKDFKIPKRSHQDATESRSELTMTKQQESLLDASKNASTALDSATTATSAEILITPSRAASDVQNALADPTRRNLVLDSSPFTDNGTSSTSLPAEEDMEVDCDQIFPDDSFSEAMDWEPQVREKISTEADQALNKFTVTQEGVLSFMDKIAPPSWCDGANRNDGDWFVVIDTNVYISSLDLVKQISGVKVPGLGSPVIYVPYRVLQELDGIKSGKLLNESSKLPVFARAAIRYINESIRDRSGKMRGQSIDKLLSMENLGVDLSADDHIVLGCSQLRSSHPGKNIVFVSNDINLRNKALIEGFPAFSGDEFKKHIQHMTDESLADEGYAPRMQTIQTMLSVVLAVLSEIVVVECQEVRRPTNLQAVVSAFSCNFSTKFSFLTEIAKEELHRIRQCLKQMDEGVNGCFINLLEAAKRFMKHFLIAAKSYFVIVKKAIVTLENLKAAVEEIDEAPNEKKPQLSAFETLLNSAFTTIEEEWERMRSESNAGQSPEESLLQINCAAEVLQTIVSSVQTLLATPARKIESSTAVIRLARALSFCSGRDEKSCETIITKACCSSGENSPILLRILEVSQPCLERLANVRSQLQSHNTS